MHKVDEMGPGNCVELLDVARTNESRAFRSMSCGSMVVAKILYVKPEKGNAMRGTYHIINHA